MKFAKDHGYRFLKDLTPDRLTAWRSTWKDEALAASKKYQRVVGFFYFCMRMKWISDNPMKSLHPPKVKQDPTLPFTAEEVNAIVSACDRFPIKGIYGEGNRKRLRAMVLLLRYSGLRIRDAATLRRKRIREGKLLLYMQKTGVPVFVPLLPEAAKILGELFAGILGSDGWAPYRRFTKAQRQLCLAHLLRRCKELLEAPPTAECANFFEQIKAVLKEALALRDCRDEGTITPHGFCSRKGKIEASMDQLLGDPDLHDESIRFALHLLTNRDALFLFLDHPDLKATNHLAEKAIRPAVINVKLQAGIARSMALTPSS